MITDNTEVKKSCYFLFWKCITALTLWPLAKEKTTASNRRFEGFLQSVLWLVLHCLDEGDKEERKRATKVTGETQTRRRFDKYCSTVKGMFTLMHQ